MSEAETVEAYYNERTAAKLRDFTDFNARIEAAVETIAEWSPPRPKRVLEIGCGIGATSWRMARAWPEAEVVGADISRSSVEVARTCFQRPNLKYLAGGVNETPLPGQFDLVVLMDVYEHIARSDRPALHAAIRTALTDEARVIMTVPTPEILAYLRAHAPEEIQPVDEDIDLEVAGAFARDTETALIHYRQVGIWRYGDYAHLVFGRFRPAAVLARQPAAVGLGGVRQLIKRLLGRAGEEGERDYLGYDFGRGPTPETLRRLRAPASERRRLAAAWKGQGA